jgi:hypothetical protein
MGEGYRKNIGILDDLDGGLMKAHIVFRTNLYKKISEPIQLPLDVESYALQLFLDGKLSDLSDDKTKVFIEKLLPSIESYFNRMLEKYRHLANDLTIHQMRDMEGEVLRHATVEDYAKWIKEYVERGKKITHYYDYPMPVDTFYVVTTEEFYVSPLYGANSIKIIVPRGVKYLGGNLGHIELFFMESPEKAKYAPIYTDVLEYINKFWPDTASLIKEDVERLKEEKKRLRMKIIKKRYNV